jgi:hypothetical protein
MVIIALLKMQVSSKQHAAANQQLSMIISV